MLQTMAIWPSLISLWEYCPPAAVDSHSCAWYALTAVVCDFPAQTGERGQNMIQRLIVAWLLASVCLLALPAWAVEYRLQVTNLDYRTFSKYLENSSPFWRGEEHMGRLEARLDTQEFPTSAVLPGREVQLLEDPHYGGKAPARVSLLPATRDQSWTTFVWDGNPGDTTAFMVKTDMVAWQEVWSVAASTT